MTKKVEVLDGIMGSGKSTNVLKWCEENPNTAFMYVTPLLTESEVRVIEACTAAKFTAPAVDGEFKTKGDHLLDLLQSGVNVSITHAMYASLRKEHLYHIDKNKYTLILDEEVSFIEPLGDDYKKADFAYLKHLKQIEVDTNGKVIWLDDEIGNGTKYTKLANMCRLGMVYQAKRSEDMFVTQLPMDLILYADRVVLLTYLFKGSILDSFLNMKGIEVVPFVDVKLKVINKKSLISLIEFVGEKQVRDWAGESLSSTWYTKSTQKEMLLLAKSIRAIGDACKAPSAELLWTAPSSVVRVSSVKKAITGAKRIKPTGYAAGTGIVVDGIANGCFLPCSSRATNAYKNRTVMVHCYNRFPHQTVSSFLSDYGVEVDPNQFALSEIVQWVWRSCIRDGKPIKLCILSKRMRKLFQDWLYEK